MSETLRSGRLRFGAHLDPWRTRRLGLWIGTDPNPSDQHGSICTDVVFRRRTSADIGQDERPCLTMEIDEAQQLMDELWRCGLRPTEGSGSAGSLAATERHLADMRAVAFGLAAQHGVEKPKERA